jgi:threonine/homoserine/homoserine lactone efflux protein
MHHRYTGRLQAGTPEQSVEPEGWRHLLPQFTRSGDPPLRLVLMMLAYEAILLGWLNLYAFLVSRAGQSRFGTRVHDILQGVTGVVLIALGVRLAFEQK